MSGPQGPNPRAIAVARSFKMAIERMVSPGLSVNGHPNPFQLNVAGTIDLMTAGEAAIADLDRFDEAVRLQKEADAKAKAAAPVVSEVKT